MGSFGCLRGTSLKGPLRPMSKTVKSAFGCCRFVLYASLLQILYEANTSNDIIIFHHPKMGSFGKTALIGQISGFSPQGEMGSFGKTALSGQISGSGPQGKWVRLGALKAHH